MKKKEIRNSIKTVYGELWDVLALYEATESYGKVPEGVRERDIWNYMEKMLLDIRKTICTLFIGERQLQGQLLKIVDETEYFVKSYSVPGVVQRWKQINPKLLFFDKVFEVRKEAPEVYKEISRGLSNLKFDCYPDEECIVKREKYFEEIEKKNEDANFRYSEERVFQNELHRTLTLVFENDFAEYL